jgi:threonylcarbamoyladenosine tRNA methylthiotransferase MtaB
MHLIPVFIKTFGCKVNYSESVSFADLLRDSGFTPLEIASAEMPTADEVARPVVFINSCCVTKEAERKAQQFVRRVKRERPDSEVLFSGCAARNYATRKVYETLGARVFSFYPEAFEWVKEHVADDRNDLSVRAELASAREAIAIAVGGDKLRPYDRARAFLKIQDGCHNCCTFCIIPFVRPYVSRPVNEVMAEVERRLDEGIREIVLTGVNIGHYGLTPVAPVHEIASEQHFRRSKLYTPVAGHASLWELLDAILARLDRAHAAGFSARLRISSIEPEEIEPRFFAQLAHPRMCPHLHLPLQSGSDKVLSDMRRLYDLPTYMQRVESFRAACPDGALTTDILVGFPTESEADFAQTLAVCNEARFEKVHGFPFSPRPGTRAALLPQLPAGTAPQRNRALLDHCATIADAQWSRFVGRSTQVLVEERSAGWWQGHGAAYQEVRLPVGAVDLTNQLVLVALTEFAEQGFTGAPVQAERTDAAALGTAL